MRLWAEKLIFLTICVTLTSLCKISIFTTNYVMNAGCLHIRYGLTNIRIGLHDWHGVTTCELIRIFITSFSTGVFFVYVIRMTSHDSYRPPRLIQVISPLGLMRILITPLAKPHCIFVVLAFVHVYRQKMKHFLQSTFLSADENFNC